MFRLVDLVRPEVLLENARSVARRKSSELTNFDVGTADEPFIITDPGCKSEMFTMCTSLRCGQMD